MPTFKQGNMWYVFDAVDYFVITTNAYVKQNGALVMGAGIARQVRDKWPGIDVEMGKAVRAAMDAQKYYGVILGEKLGIFQVKYYFADAADLDLIWRSATELERVAREMPDKTFALNFPGIGNGKLSRELVAPLLKGLPDNVQVWSFT